MLRIGNIATCDLHNYGDLLYPLFVQKMLQARGWKGETNVYSFIEGMAPGKAGYTVKNINNIFNSKSTQLDYLVIGGGDIIRTDIETIASHYITDENNQIFQRIINKVKNKFGLAGVKSFVKSHMSYSSISPYIIDPVESSDAISSTIYCSCGVPFSFQQNPHKDQIRKAFNNASFIYLRDKTSREKLVDIGVEKEIYVAPDIITTMSDFFDADHYKKLGLSILKNYKIDIQKKILLFQTKPRSEKEEQVIIEQLRKYKKQNNNVEVVLIPIGYCHQDHQFLEKLAKLSQGDLKYVGVYSIYDILSVIAASDIFLGTSLHGNVTAFSFGIPHLFGPTKFSKVEGFLDMVDLPQELKLSSWLELEQKINMVSQIERKFFANRALAAKQKVHQTFDMLFDVMKSKIMPSTD